MSASEARLLSVPWRALVGLGPALDAPLSAVLGGEPAERALDRFLRDHRSLPGEARRAVAEAMFGVGLWRRRLAWHAGAEQDAPFDPGDGVPPTAEPAWARAHAPAVSWAGASGSLPVAGARRLLAALVRDLGGLEDAERLLELAPGLLPPPRPPPGDVGRRWSLPDWLVDVLAREVGDELPALADALNLPGPVCLRVNALRTTPDRLAAALAAEGVATRRGRLVPGALVVTSPRPNVYGLAAHRDGLFEVQDEGSQLVGQLVGARPGEAVLDLCAGAGGKTLQLAAAVAPGGIVHACDVDPGRLARLRVRAERAGAAQLVRVHGDRPPPGLRVDRALVDAPCSELGALRRGPDLRFRIDPGSLAAWPPLQRALLARAAAHLRPGGRLVYATCTVRREENAEVVAAFQADHRYARLEPDLAQRPAGARGLVATWPHRHGCDGFFAAAWSRGP